MRWDKGSKENEVKLCQKGEGRIERDVGSRLKNSLDAQMREKEIKDSK